MRRNQTLARLGGLTRLPQGSDIYSETCSKAEREACDRERKFQVRGKRNRSGRRKGHLGGTR